MQSEHPEWAAYLIESDITAPLEAVAQAYQRAGEILSHKKPALAYNLLLTASGWYEEIGDIHSAQRCLRMASRLSRGPHIHINGVTVPRIWQEDNYFTAVFELKNLGHTTAHQLKARFAGDVKTRIWVEIQDMPPGAIAEVEVPLMANTLGNLTVETRFQDSKGTDLRTTRRFEIQEVKPFEGVIIEGSEGWMELKDIPGKVIVKGDVGIIKMGFDKSSPQKN